MEKTVIFFLTLLMLAILGGIVVNPQGVKSVYREKAPLFEFKDYTFYHIDQTGVNEYLRSSEGYHYDEFDLIKNIEYHKKESESTSIIKSDTAHIYKEYTDFNGSVIYLLKGGYKLNTRDVRYNKHENKISGAKPFLITSETGEFRGNSFIVDTKKRALEAQNIKAVYFY